FTLHRFDGDLCSRGRRRNFFWMSRPTVFLEKIIDPGTRALERTIRRWNVDFQQFHFIRGFCPLVSFYPDTLLLRDDFALAVECTATRSVPELLRTGLRTHILQIGDDAVAAFLAAKGRRLDHKLSSRKRMSQRWPFINPAHDLVRNPV